MKFFSESLTHSTNAGMDLVAATLVAGAAMALLQPRELINR